MEYSSITLSVNDRVATIRLNRPDALNALSLPLLREFAHATAAVGADRRSRPWWCAEKAAVSAPAPICYTLTRFLTTFPSA